MMIAKLRLLAACTMLVPSVACSPAEGVSENAEPYDGVGEDETVSLIGTEPFWGLTVNGSQARYSTPDNVEGVPFAVTRFAGNNGLGYSGTIDDIPFVATLTPGGCSDGMSDRSYPFTATVVFGDATLRGCGYTSAQSFQGEASP